MASKSVKDLSKALKRVIPHSNSVFRSFAVKLIEKKVFAVKFNNFANALQTRCDVSESLFYLRILILGDIDILKKLYLACIDDIDAGNLVKAKSHIYLLSELGCGVDGDDLLLHFSSRVGHKVHNVSSHQRKLASKPFAPSGLFSGIVPDIFTLSVDSDFINLIGYSALDDLEKRLVYLTNLPISVTASDVERAFTSCGVIRKVEIIRFGDASSLNLYDPNAVAAMETEFHKKISPVNAILEFDTEEGAINATKDELRVLGVLISSSSALKAFKRNLSEVSLLKKKIPGVLRICYPDRAIHRRSVIISDVPPAVRAEFLMALVSDCLTKSRDASTILATSSSETEGASPFSDPYLFAMKSFYNTDSNNGLHEFDSLIDSESQFTCNLINYIHLEASNPHAFNLKRLAVKSHINMKIPELLSYPSVPLSSENQERIEENNLKNNQNYIFNNSNEASFHFDETTSNPSHPIKNIKTFCPSTFNLNAYLPDFQNSYQHSSQAVQDFLYEIEKKRITESSPHSFVGDMITTTMNRNIVSNQLVGSRHAVIRAPSFTIAYIIVKALQQSRDFAIGDSHLTASFSQWQSSVPPPSPCGRLSDSHYSPAFFANKLLSQQSEICKKSINPIPSVEEFYQLEDIALGPKSYPSESESHPLLKIGTGFGINK